MHFFPCEISIQRYIIKLKQKALACAFGKSAVSHLFFDKGATCFRRGWLKPRLQAEAPQASLKSGNALIANNYEYALAA